MRTLLLNCALLCGSVFAAAPTVVVLGPGDAVQKTVASLPAGTTFIFQPGVYRLQSIQPLDNDTFIGEPGAVLNGSTLVTGFAQNGKLWSAPFAVPPGQLNGDCDAAHPMCRYDEDLYFDDKPLLHVGSLDAVIAGSYFIDYTNGVAYLADNPTGHVVEIATARSAFSGSASGVTITGFVVEKYAVPAQFGAIGDQYPGPGWILFRNEVRLNHGAGISLAQGGVAIKNRVHDNGQKGIGGAADGIVVQANEVANNNYAGFEPGWEAAGMKFALATGLVVRNNYVHGNKGAGIWCDIDCKGALIEGNTVVGNTNGSGIQYEISAGATIRNNTVRNNYAPNGGWWMWGAQILLQNSADSDVYGNTVDVAGPEGNAIGIINQNRGAGHDAVGNYLHHNTVIIRGQTNGNTGIVSDYLGAGRNRFDYNTFHVADAGGYHWAWGQGMTWAQFQAAGQEQHGALDGAVPPAASN